MRLATYALLGLVVIGARNADAAQLGDINGDGRVSAGDAFLLNLWQVTGLELYEPADGSTDFEPDIQCSRFFDLPFLLFLEAIRRESPTPFPHFIERWPEDERAQGPHPPEDASVKLEVLDVQHASGEKEVELRVKLSSPLPVHFIALLVRVVGLDLRPRRPADLDDKDDFLATSEHYMIAGGAFLAYRSSFGFFRPPDPIEPDKETIIELRGLVPRGTEPGSYRVELLPGTEVVTTFGELVRPEVASGTLEIEQTIETGHDLALPPLRFVEEDRRVLGGFQARITDAAGLPGEEVAVKVQVRAERPVNYLEFTVSFDQTVLELREEVTLSYTDPEVGHVREIDHDTHVLNPPPGRDSGGTLRYKYVPTPLEVVDESSLDPITRDVSRGYSAYQNTYGKISPALKYMAPLGEWIDLVELRFRILSGARGHGDLAVSFSDDRFDNASFRPYPKGPPSGDVQFSPGCDDTAAWWEYGPEEWTAGTITVLGSDDPPPPPEPPVDPERADIRVFLGQPGEDPELLVVEPGEVFDVPVAITADVDLTWFRFVYRFDDSQLELLGFELNLIDFDGSPFTEFLVPQPLESDFCYFVTNDGIFPAFAQIQDEHNHVPPGTLFLDIQTSWWWSGRGAEPTLVAGKFWTAGKARFRVRADASLRSTGITGTQVQWKPIDLCWFAPAATFLEAETSGQTPFDRSDPPRSFWIPANVVEGATVIIPHEGDPRFLRADSNGDDSLDLSDAVHVLTALFQGSATIDCEDASDANDDGRLDITDAIFTLTHLFQSGPEPPFPFPEASIDPTDDELGCERSEGQGEEARPER